MYEGAAEDNDSIKLSQQSNIEHPGNQQPSDESNENTVIFMNKVITKPNDKINENTVFLMNEITTNP